ncbi:uncharacterized protein LOC126879972 [Diabrotica virgifera virgifera]|uniref:Uncharacterized protein LOC114340323 n=1 Tax=Diabrotica virgifera virgifera TaxID=50390 RepID=A0A6P7GSS7_DIAVI|nr:uncharacterized protein LOC126879972 [Diabrotica virgifera virgifera]
MFQFISLLLIISLYNVSATVTQHGCRENNIDINRFISPGETCAEITCAVGGITIKGCPQYGVLPPNCVIGSSKEDRQFRNFPDCCPLVYCGGIIVTPKFTVRTLSL